MTADLSDDDQRFQPGQIGIQHLLGVMAVVCIVVAFSATTLRTLPTMRAVELIVHWALVAAIAAVMFYTNSLRRRRERAQSGALLLRVLRRPVTGGERRLISWLLISVVVVEAVVMSVVILHFLPEEALIRIVLSSPFSVLVLLGGQGALWAYCLTHCLGSVYWIEFRENGVLTHARYYPWSTITRIGWSPANPGNLVMLHCGLFQEMTIDPASRGTVDELLKQRASN